MREIEVKVKVEDFENMKDILINLGCSFSEPLRQEDRIFLKNGVNLENFSRGDIALRIRKSNGELTMNLKKQHENELDNFEQEILINDGLKAEEILNALGYEKVIEVSKRRIKTRFNDYEICFDEVKKLGKFVEVEKLTNEEDGLKVQEELLDFLKGLGANIENKVEKDYDTLLWEKNRNGI